VGVLPQATAPTGQISPHYGQPIEGAWANTKGGLGNLAATEVDQLTAIVKNRLNGIQYRPALIDGFLGQTGLSLELEPPQTAASVADRGFR
jgi:putative transposase